MRDKSLYYDKYLIYKRKYEALKLQQKLNTDYSFYFIHSTNINNLISIINQNVIKVGMDVTNNKRRFSKNDPLEFVFANIYFEDIKNLSHFWDVSIILHPKILLEYNGIFSEGWTGGFAKNSIYFNKNNSSEELNKKIERVRNFVKNPKSLPNIVQEASGLIHHEFSFNKSISLKDNIIGIVCNSCPEEDLSKIKKSLKKHNFPPIMILTKNYPFPTLDELLSYSE